MGKVWRGDEKIVELWRVRGEKILESKFAK